MEISNDKRMDLEAQIMRSVISELLENTGVVLSVFDGEETTITGTDKDALFEALRTTDEDILRVKRTNDEGQIVLRGWIQFVYGNEPGVVISDHTINLESLLPKTMALADQIYDEYSAADVMSLIDSTKHIEDSDCTVNPETNLCESCGVEHGDPCPMCGGKAFHAEDCPRNDAKIDSVVEDAQLAFWAAVAKAFPRIKTGDFGPGETMDFKDACYSAVRTWLSNNEPEAE